MGRARVIGKGEKAKLHLKNVRQFTDKQCIKHIDNAFNKWRKRSQKNWDLDLSLLTSNGIKLQKKVNKKERKTISENRLKNYKSKSLGGFGFIDDSDDEDEQVEEATEQMKGIVLSDTEDVCELCKKNKGYGWYPYEGFFYCIDCKNKYGCRVCDGFRCFLNMGKIIVRDECQMPCI